MLDFSEMIAQGAGNAWFFIPSAILLGALHGLEPGHSKTMMAAFIVEIRGTVWQAVLLGLAATISHTMVVWATSWGGLYFYQGLDAGAVEPYFQLLSAAIIIGLALWMIQRTWRDQQVAKAAWGTITAMAVPTTTTSMAISMGMTRPANRHGHGVLRVEIFEAGQPPKWRVKSLFGQSWSAGGVSLTTERPEGAKQIFAFTDKGEYLESVDDIPEPHELWLG